MKKITLKTALGIATAFFALNVNAQCLEISCPSDITVNNDTGECGAIVNYTTPVGADPCSSQDITFTNSGATGRSGPTQLQVDAEYLGGPLAGQVTITTQGIQEWTVPTTGSYTLEVVGARGGSSNATYLGGFGASMKGVLLLTAGDQLKIIVGQKGHDVGYAGGGGASAVSLNNNPLIVAGGGGGSNSVTNPNNGYNASTGTDGVASYTVGGTGGNGSDGGFAQGGSGYFTDGLNLGLSGTTASQSLQGGALGGLGYTQTYWGGFGGGGSGFGGGGGGGGYSGGGGGHYTCCTSVEAPGGGGGSFNSGTNQINTVGVNTDHGHVIITYNGSITTTQTAGLASGSLFPVGTTTNTFEVNDGLGNSEQCSFDVIVEDIEAPVLDAATLPDVVAECQITSLVEATATDNCGGTIYGTHSSTFPITSNTTLVWTFVDAAGNSTTQTQEVIVSGLNVAVTVNDPTLTADNTEAGVTYQWIDCDSGISIEGATSQSFTPEANGRFAVVIKLGNCINISGCFTVATVSLNEQIIPGFKLFPNPNNGQFTLESVEYVEQYTIVDANGRLVQKGNPKSTSFEVNLDPYETGMYFLHVNGEVIKVIKK